MASIKITGLVTYCVGTAF